MGRIIHRNGAGQARDYWAIKKWLHENGIAITQVAKDVGVCGINGSRTIQGKMNHRKILGRLLELGCPPAILDLPVDMKELGHATQA